MKNDFLNKTVSMEEIETNGQIGENDMDITMSYATAIEQELNDNNFIFRSQRKKDATVFDVIMPSDKLHLLQINMIVDDDGDTKLRCYLASGIDLDKVSSVVEEINHLNCRFRFICLSVDEDRDVCAANDFILFGEAGTAAHNAITTLVLFADIVDKCVPSLMPIIWSNSKEKDEPVKVKTGLFGSEGGVA